MASPYKQDWWSIACFDPTSPPPSVQFPPHGPSPHPSRWSGVAGGCSCIRDMDLLGVQRGPVALRVRSTSVLSFQKDTAFHARRVPRRAVRIKRLHLKLKRLPTAESLPEESLYQLDSAFLSSQTQRQIGSAGVLMACSWSSGRC